MRRVTLFLLASSAVIFGGCEPSSRTTAPVVKVDPKESVATAADASTAPDVVADAGTKTTRRLFVADHWADCEGEGKRRCLRVRESPDEEWRLFYGRIEGFTYEDGHAYELEVEASDGSGRADAPRTRYRLVTIVSKTKR